MNVIVVGGGSVGRRHIHNLRQLGVEHVGVVDVAEAELGATVYDSLEAALTSKPNAVVVATPTNLHVEPAVAAMRAGAHVLIESPLASSVADVEVLETEATRAGVYAMVGCSFRFDDVYRAVQASLDEGTLGRVHSANLLFGGAQRAQGDGIVLDAIHEVDLALRWFGDLERVQAATTHDVEDSSDAVLQFRSGVIATVHLDCLAPVHRRQAWISGDEGVLRADFKTRRVVVETRERTTETSFPDETNAMYERELEYFLDVVRGTFPPRITLGEGADALRTALSIRDGAPVAPRPRLPAKVSVVVQARMGSSRLPGKVLLGAGGKTMLEIQIERIRRAKLVDRIVIATSSDERDRAIVAEADRLGVEYFIGSEDDVLERYIGAVRKWDMGAVVRLTADCPFTDPAVVDFTIGRFLEAKPDYCTNAVPRSVPKGLDVEVMTRAALERAHRQATAKPDREHVTHFFYTHRERFEVISAAPADPVLAAHRWTLDTEADYVFLKAVFEAVYPKDPAFGMNDVLAFSKAHPEHAQTLARELARSVRGTSPLL